MCHQVYHLSNQIFFEGSLVLSSRALYVGLAATSPLSLGGKSNQTQRYLYLSERFARRLNRDRVISYIKYAGVFCSLCARNDR